MDNETVLSKRTLLIISGIICLAIFLVAIISVTTVSNEGCVIDIKDKEEFTDLHPLLLQFNSSNFVFPNNGSKIILNASDSLRLACPGQNNYLAVDNEILTTITCFHNKTFLVNGNGYLFKDLKCMNYLEPSVQVTKNKCAGKYTQTEIGFNTSKEFVNLITTCFDDTKKDSLYSVHTLYARTNDLRISSKRPDFIQDTFYGSLQLDDLYYYPSQKKIFNEIIGISISITKKRYFNRGHLAPKADFIYGFQQRATFYYLNVAPQWNQFNDGNWNELEKSCREYVANKSIDLIVYTGIYETARIANDKPGLSLYADENKNMALTVPNIFWKILYEPLSKSGIVFVSHNNPEEKSCDAICSDICNKINWLSWQPNNVNAGISYCCNYADVKKNISYLPDIQINQLLT